MPEHADLLARHRRVLPSWLALYYDEPIALVDGEGRHVTDAEGNTLPRLLRRDPHDHDGLQRARGRRGDPRASRADAPHLDAVPHRARRSSWPRRLAELSNIPDAKVFFTTSGSEANEAALLLASNCPQEQPGAGAAQQLPRPFVRDDRHHRQPRLVGVEPHALQRAVRAERLPLPQPVPRPRRRRRSPPPSPTTCAT